MTLLLTTGQESTNRHSWDETGNIVTGDGIRHFASATLRPHGPTGVVIPGTANDALHFYLEGTQPRNELIFRASPTSGGTTRHNFAYNTVFWYGFSLYFPADEVVSSTSVNTTNDTFAVSNSEKYPTGAAVRFTTSGTLPGGLATGVTRYVINVTSTTIKFATTQANALAGTAINLTSQGTGNHTIKNGWTNDILGNTPVVVFQTHTSAPTSGASPCIGVRAAALNGENGVRLTFTREWNPNYPSSSNGFTASLAGPLLAYDTEHKFVIQTEHHWLSSQTPLYRIWVNADSESDTANLYNLDGPCGASNDGDIYYLKRGMYRSSPTVPVLNLFMGQFKIGNSAESWSTVAPSGSGGGGGGGGGFDPAGYEFVDTFAETTDTLIPSHSPDKTPGVTWAQTHATETASCEANQNKLKFSGANAGCRISLGSDQTVEVKLNLGGADNRPFLEVRRDTLPRLTENCYRWVFRAGLNQIQLQKVVAGTATTLRQASFTFNTSANYTLQASCVTSNDIVALRLSINDASQTNLDYDDAASILSTGDNVGLNAGSTVTNNAHRFYEFAAQGDPPVDPTRFGIIYAAEIEVPDTAANTVVLGGII